jgi:hypothetical protein
VRCTDLFVVVLALVLFLVVTLGCGFEESPTGDTLSILGTTTTSTRVKGMSDMSGVSAPGQEQLSRLRQEAHAALDAFLQAPVDEYEDEKWAGVTASMEEYKRQLSELTVVDPMAGAGDDSVAPPGSPPP